MIKGSMKNVIIIRDTGSEVFEQAIFVVRPTQKPFSKRFIRSEARRIIEENTNIKTGKSKLFGK